ncbi:MAG: FecR domain-containing protein [Pseudobacter sp.]|uniref:FecR domain-containing protein n=1 Tax=Pseudobacter sp. TaxID=2045420 RepID=UPI003F7DE99A
MTNEAFRDLFQRYFEGLASEEERRALMQHIAAAPEAELELAMREQWLSFEKPDADVTAERGAVLLRSILDNDTMENKELREIRTARTAIYLRRWWVAASVMLILGAGIFFWVSNSKTNEEIVQRPVDVAPGREGAVLTLADGKQVMLDEVKDSVVALQGGATARVVNGQLVYEGRGNEAVFNSMSTPKGRQYNLKLPDGTQVWLNSESSIRYPTVFNGKERKVEVTGEAYFSVTKNNKMPFIVKVNAQTDIQVLGTEFNVNAYTNEAAINTTLLEGSVRVHADKLSQILSPGQQAQIGQDKKIRLVKEVDIDKVIAWKNGYFNFNDADLHEIMRQLERWYDIEVVYAKPVQPVEFRGKLERSLSLSQVLEGLQLMQVNFRIEGRKVIIEP